MTADMFPDLLTKNERRELLTLRVERDAYQTQAGLLRSALQNLVCTLVNVAALDMSEPQRSAPTPARIMEVIQADYEHAYRLIEADANITKIMEGA